MRRFAVLSAALACLGGCTCKGAPAPPASMPDAGRAAPQPPRAEQAPPPARPPLPEQAMVLHAQGREHGAAGRFQEALRHFEQVRALAPGWLLPLYDVGLTHLLMGEDARALATYEQLDGLAPEGLADSQRILDGLRRERDGRVPKGTYRQYLEVQRLRDEAEVRRRLQALTRRAPGFVPAWLDLALSTEDVAEAERLLARALALGPDAGTRGELLLRQAQLLRQRGEHAEARRQLQALAQDAALPEEVRTRAREALQDPGLH